MTITEIETKIAEYDSWLVQHPTRPDYHLVRNSKEAWQAKLKEANTHNLEVTAPEVLTHETKRAYE